MGGIVERELSRRDFLERAGALGAGAMILAALHGRLTWPLIWHGMQSTMRTVPSGVSLPNTSVACFASLARLHVVPSKRSTP